MAKTYIATKAQVDAKVDKVTGKSLVDDTEITKLAGVAAGAQVNVLEGIKFNGTDATITEKKVNITPAGIGAAASSHTHGNADLLTGIDAAKIASISGSVLPVEVMPKAALWTLKVVADAAARLALTISDVQNGDVVKQNDTGVLYFVKDETKLGTEAAFEMFKAGEAASVQWVNVLNKVNASATENGLMTSSDFTKLAGIAAGAEVNVNADWNATEGDAQILNKPTLGTAAAKDFTTAVTSGSADVVTSGAVYTELEKKVDKVTGKGLSTNDYTTAEKTKLGGIAEGAQVNVLESVKDASGTALTITGKAVTLSKAAVGLGNVDNTSDANKPISTATQTALNGKVTLATGSQSYTLGVDENGLYFE